MQGRRLHLIAGNLQADDSIEGLLRHEIVTHYGLDIMDPADKLAILKQITASHYVPFIKQHWDEVSKTYGKQYKKRPLKVAEEVLARISELDPANAPTVWETIIDSIMAIIKKLGFFKGKLTNSDVRKLSKSMANGIR